MRLIDADALKEKVRKVEQALSKVMLASNRDFSGDDSLTLITSLRSADSFKEMIDIMPTISDKGEWIAQDDTYTRFMCSVCKGENHKSHEKFCCDCGADMRGDGK